MDNDTLALLEDVNASLSDALGALASGRTNDAAQILKAILDPVREALEAAIPEEN